MDSITKSLSTDGPGGRDLETFRLTPESLIELDYIAPPATISDYVTTLYFFRCEEPVFHDIHPASIGHLVLFPKGKGHMHFRSGRSDPNPGVALMTPLSTATPIIVDGPFHAIGAALSPLGWAALTGLHAGENSNRLLPAMDVLGAQAIARGEEIVAEYCDGELSGRDAALAVGQIIAENVRRVNSRHCDLIKTVNAWLGATLNPDIEELMAAAAYSPRQVQRLTERYFGLPPKALARKYRALRAAALLSFPELTPEWEEQLDEAFFDQSHMIREITCFVGRTPARLGDANNPYLSEMIDPKNFRELDL